MPIVRPKEVIQQIDTIYPLWQGDSSEYGKGPIPLNGQTVSDLGTVIRLCGQIPEALLPQGQQYLVYEKARITIQDGIERAKSGTSRDMVVFGTPTLDPILEFDGLNALAGLRTSLATAQNYTRAETRFRLLQLIAEHEKATSRGSYYSDQVATDTLELPLGDVRRQLAICKHDGLVELVESID